MSKQQVISQMLQYIRDDDDGTECRVSTLTLLQWVNKLHEEEPIATSKLPIDTSLAASVSRFTGWIENAIFDEPLGSDCIAVRDAARKWDEHCREPKTLGYENGSVVIGVESSNDPDGVGEGWRKCGRNEAEEWRLSTCLDWQKMFTLPDRMTLGCGVVVDYRRRIEAEQ